MKSISNQQQTVPNKANLIKYLNPSTLIQPKPHHRTRSQLSNNNIHCRSMQDLQMHPSGAISSQQQQQQQQSSKQNIKPNMHYSSLYNNEKQNMNSNNNNNKNNEQQQNKSRSLSKFITFFENSNLMGQMKKEVVNENNNKRRNYNGFCYDLRMNSTAGNSNNNQKKIMRKKDKQNSINYQTVTNNNHRQHNNNNTYNTQTRSPLMSSKQAHNNNSNNNLSDEIDHIFKLRQSIQNYKQRESIYNQKISQLHQRQQHLCSCIQKLQQQKQLTDKKLIQYQTRIKQLQIKNKQTIEKNRMMREQKSSKKDISREHNMVIKSLKKVINQQLTKIIELERVKIQNQYLREKILKKGNNNNDDSFSSQSGLSNQGDYSFQHQYKVGRGKGESGSSTVRSSVDCEFGVDVFKKTKPLKNELTNKANQKETHQHQQHSSSRHFKSFFQVEQSSVSSLDGNIMNLFKPYESRKKSGQSIDGVVKQQNGMIKISQPQSSFTREAIQEVNEDNYDNQLSEHKRDSQNRSHSFDDDEQDESSLRQESDSILEEVDQYLTKWRNQQA